MSVIITTEVSDIKSCPKIEALLYMRDPQRAWIIVGRQWNLQEILRIVAFEIFDSKIIDYYRIIPIFIVDYSCKISKSRIGKFSLLQTLESSDLACGCYMHHVTSIEFIYIKDMHMIWAVV